MIQTMWTPASDGVLAGARHSGESGPVLIFVHGVGSSAAIWDYQLDALAGRYACYAVELRGNGSAQKEPALESISREGFVKDVLAIADAAHADRFHFIGCSLGGVVGFQLWRDAPARMLSMTTVGSFAKYPNAEKQVQTIIESVSQAANLGDFARSRAEKVLPPNPPQRRIDETIAQMGAKSLPSYIASTKATWSGDYTKDLHRISIPTLVICGELDPIAPLPLSEEIAAGIPDAGLRVISGAGHVVNADAPQRFNEELVTFLETLAPTVIDE